MDIAVLEVVVVNIDRAGESIGLGVNGPGSLPFSTPESVEVGVDAADIDLEVAILVETKAGASGTILVIRVDVVIDRLLDSCPIRQNRGLSMTIFLVLTYKRPTVRRAAQGSRWCHRRSLK